MNVEWVKDGRQGITDVDLVAAEKRCYDGQSLAEIVAADITRGITDDSLSEQDEIVLTIFEPAGLAASFVVVRAPYDIRGRTGISYAARQVAVQTKESRHGYAKAVMRTIPEDQVDHAFQTILTDYGDRVDLTPRLNEYQGILVERLENLYEDGSLHGLGRTVLSAIDGSVGVMVEAAIDDGIDEPDYQAKLAFANETGHVLMVAGTKDEPRKTLCCFVWTDPEIDLAVVGGIAKRVNSLATCNLDVSSTPSL